MRYVSGCGKWFKVFVGGGAPTVLNCSIPADRGLLLSAWLVAAGDGSYFMCGDEGAVTSTFPEFHKALGKPNGPAHAVVVGGKQVLVRDFSSGTRAIFMPHPSNRTALGAGCVKWADQTISGQCPC